MQHSAAPDPFSYEARQIWWRSGVRTAKQLTERLPPEQRAPASALMLRPIVDHVAPLAEGREVGVRVVRGVVISMGRGQNDPGPAAAAEDVGLCRNPDPAAPPITPPTGVSIPPATVTEVIDHPPVRPPTSPAATPSPAEPDHSRELRPIDRVEEAMLEPDRHGGAPYHRV